MALVGSYNQGNSNNSDYQNNQYQNGQYQENHYQNGQYQGSQYQNSQYQGNQYQNSQYQGSQYSDSQNYSQYTSQNGYTQQANTQQGYSQSSSALNQVNRNQKESVLFGNHLCLVPPQIPNDYNTVLYFKGRDCYGNQVWVPISENLLSRHMMLIGGIGTGKTNAFFQMLFQLNGRLTQNDVMIIFDTKGDFVKEFYTPGDVIISNDRMAVGPEGTADYWNIFNEVAPGEQEYASVMEISKSLFKEACEKTSQVFFPNAARDIFMAIMLHFLRYAHAKNDYRFLNNEELIKFIKSKTSSELRAMLDSYPDLRAMTSYIESDDSPQTQGVISELQQIVRNIFVGNFAKKGTLGLQSLVRAKGGRKIFIEYDLSYGELLTPIYSLMFDMGIKEALGRGRSEGNVYFITDEFRLLPNLEHVDDAVNFGRSLGIKFMIGIQNVEQIYDNYGEERAHSIMSGFLTSLNFRVNDPKSREYIKDLFGKNRKIEVYATSVQSKGMVEERREGNVVEDWNVTNLKIGQAIIGFPEYEPFIFQFDVWNE